ncbi:MAG: hypothetical protein ABI775_06660 [Pseudonocardiales bacterium]
MTSRPRYGDADDIGGEAIAAVLAAAVDVAGADVLVVADVLLVGVVLGAALVGGALLVAGLLRVAAPAGVALAGLVEAALDRLVATPDLLPAVLFPGWWEACLVVLGPGFC